MKINKKLMRKAREACREKEDRKYVRELIDLSRDDVDKSSLYRMLDEYRDGRLGIRYILDAAKNSSNLTESEIRDIIKDRTLESRTDKLRTTLVVTSPMLVPLAYVAVNNNGPLGWLCVLGVVSIGASLGYLANSHDELNRQSINYDEMVENTIKVKDRKALLRNREILTEATQ